MKQFHLCLTTVKIAYTPVKELECIQEANDQACGRPGRFLWDPPDWMDAPDTWGAGRNKLALHERYVRSSKNIIY